MKIRINGELVEEKEGITIKDIFETRGVDESRRVAVELNGEIVPRDRWEETILSAGDTLEIIHFIGGGNGTEQGGRDRYIIRRMKEKLDRLRETTENGKRDSLLGEIGELYYDLLLAEDRTLNIRYYRVIQILERERQHLAREIHDGPAQVLAALVRNLEYCEKLVRDGERTDELKTMLKETRDHIRREIGGLRRMISRLRPPVLDDLGLKEAIESLASRMARETGREVRTKGPDTWPHFSPDDELNIYRILQESLSNIWKHSDTRTVEVRFIDEGSEWRWEVEDFGSRVVNLETAEDASTGAGLGLIHMQERAQLMDARLEFFPKQEGGLLICLRIRKREGTC